MYYPEIFLDLTRFLNFLLSNFNDNEKLCSSASPKNEEIELKLECR